MPGQLPVILLAIRVWVWSQALGDAVIAAKLIHCRV